MSRRFSSVLLLRIRNEVPISDLIRDHLGLPWKNAEGLFRFLCPLCSEFHTATNPKTNLARCFRCRRNFNPIDMLMVVDHCTFVQAVTTLRRLLPDYGPATELPPNIHSGQPAAHGV